MAARGLPDPFARPAEPASDQAAPGGEREAETATEPTFFQPDSAITTTVDVAPYVERKQASFRCHRTQFNATSFGLTLPPDLAREAFSQESFVLARTRVAAPRPEDDLFAGVR